MRLESFHSTFSYFFKETLCSSLRGYFHPISTVNFLSWHWCCKANTTATGLPFTDSLTTTCPIGWKSCSHHARSNILPPPLHTQPWTQTHNCSGSVFALSLTSCMTKIHNTLQQTSILTNTFNILTQRHK